MSKYINVDDQLVRLRALELNCEDVVKQFLLTARAADVAEVRHGEWVFKFYCINMSGYDYGMTCSVCGKPTHRQFAEKMPPYCPNCGTKMDEVE